MVKTRTRRDARLAQPQISRATRMADPLLLARTADLCLCVNRVLLSGKSNDR